MVKFDIPFKEEFNDHLAFGRKTVTSRTKKYGEPGDWFERNGMAFVLTDVKRILLGDVAEELYYEEGFEHEDEFKQVWNDIHPRRHFREDDMVWVHTFKRVG